MSHPAALSTVVLGVPGVVCGKETGYRDEDRGGTEEGQRRDRGGTEEGQRRDSGGTEEGQRRDRVGEGKKDKKGDSGRMKSWKQRGLSKRKE